MKKKNKSQQKTDMPDFAFKEFTAEESRIYEEAIKKFREEIGAGKSLKEAYESYPIADQELRSIVQADFLKIVIAERHFGQGRPLEEIEKSLSISHELALDTKKRMLQEVGITAASQFSEEHGPLKPESND